MTVIKGSDVQQQQQPCIITHNESQRGGVSRDHAPAIRRTDH